jgi:hypothetical protein
MLSLAGWNSGTGVVCVHSRGEFDGPDGSNEFDSDVTSSLTVPVQFIHRYDQGRTARGPGRRRPAAPTGPSPVASLARFRSN